MGKYIKLFQTEEEYQTAVNNETILYPNVSFVTKEDLVYFNNKLSVRISVENKVLLIDGSGPEVNETTLLLSNVQADVNDKTLIFN